MRVLSKFSDAGGKASPRMNHIFLKHTKSVVFEETDTWDFLRWVQVTSLESAILKSLQSVSSLPSESRAFICLMIFFSPQDFL